MQNKREEEPIRMCDLYPHLNEEQLKEAEENFDRYLEIVLRIYERLNSDPKIVDNPTF
jgi:hypothetical protein